MDFRFHEKPELLALMPMCNIFFYSEVFIIIKVIYFLNIIVLCNILRVTIFCSSVLFIYLLIFIIQIRNFMPRKKAVFSILWYIFLDIFTFSYPCNGKESIVLRLNFRNGYFDGFTRYEVS